MTPTSLDLTTLVNHAAKTNEPAKIEIANLLLRQHHGGDHEAALNEHPEAKWALRCLDTFAAQSEYKIAAMTLEHAEEFGTVAEAHKARQEFNKVAAKRKK